ncbi:MAG TPA: hypothetical protein VMH61_08060 [Candidatus Acidoferrales bacterium]|nr:hypothetical protein [Candidatus Acidoferrales bacterium]
MTHRLLRLFGISAAMLVVSGSAWATSATPSGELNMAWTNCSVDAGTSDKAFACNTNNGSATLVLSFTAPTAPPIDSLSGAEAYVDLISASSPLSQWWSMFNSGTCRQSALTGNATIPGSAANCFDAWNAQAGVAGVAAYTIGALSNDAVAGNLPGVNSGNIAQVACIDIGAAVPPSQLQQLQGGQEYFVFNVKVAYTGTVGGACAGCSDPVCLSFSHLRISQPVGIGDWWITTPGPSQTGMNVTWQGGAGANCSAVPTKTKTWGALKSMYR